MNVKVDYQWPASIDIYHWPDDGITPPIGATIVAVCDGQTKKYRVVSDEVLQWSRFGIKSAHAKLLEGEKHRC